MLASGSPECQPNQPFDAYLLCHCDRTYFVILMRTCFVIATVPTLSLRAQRGNLVGVATAVRRRVFTLIEIATSLSSSL